MMPHAVILGVLLVITLGCGGADAPEGDGNDADMDEASSDLNAALAVAASKDPAVRLSAWQREWINDGEYTRPDSGVFEARRFEFIYRWSFTARDAVLTVSPRLDLDDEEKDFVHTFVTELAAEWSIGPRFIYDQDRRAGSDACNALRQLIIDEAIKLEESTNGNVYPNAYQESKPERIADMKGPNRLLASSLAYKTLLKSGKRLSSDEVVGDVFSFRASAEFKKDGAVTATLFVNGR